MKIRLKNFFWLFGLLGIFLFHAGFYFPFFISVIIFMLSGFYLIILYRKSKVGLLTLLLFIVYALPFIHIIPYIWYDFDPSSSLFCWGLTFNSYMSDITIMELTAMIGAVGVLGFIAGLTLIREKNPLYLIAQSNSRAIASPSTQSLSVFLIWIALAVVLSWLVSPKETIFTQIYTQSEAINANWNFSSLWMISYAFLIFCLSDSIFEPSLKIAKLKRIIVLFATLVIVVWFQLLRGDRESLPCVLALFLMYYVWSKNIFSAKKHKPKLNFFKIFLLLMIILVVSFIIGIARSLFVGCNTIMDISDLLSRLAESGIFSLENLFQGTWSAVLLTPISVAGNYIHGILSLNYGETYLNLLLSIIPGFLADWIGYTRPIDGLHGPACEMTYGIGGTHATVVPFMDFRMAGVFFIIALWSFIFAKIEHYTLRSLTVSKLALLGIIATVIPHWLWYGEKNILNALIIWFAVSLLYRLRIKPPIPTPSIENNI